MAGISPDDRLSLGNGSFRVGLPLYRTLLQVESELKVTVYGKSSRSRQHVFLGDVIIPLSDIQEDMDTLDDIRTYDLSRRSRYT